MKVSLVPSLPATSFFELQSLLEQLKGEVGGFQVDIVDGSFVEASAWPFVEGSKIEDLCKLSKYNQDFELEIDCMVDTPEQYLDIILSVGFKRVVIHYGSTERFLDIVNRLHSSGVKVGIAFTSDTSIDEVEDVIKKADFVQVMGIKNVGQQGEPFDSRTYETIRNIKALYPDKEIAVDGAVNAKTISELHKAGANRLAPGSAVTKADNPLHAYKQLESLIQL